MKALKCAVLALLAVSPCVAGKTPGNLPDVVTLIGPYAINHTQAQNSVIHLKLPESGTAIVGFSGGDEFVEIWENTSRLSTKTSGNKKSLVVSSSLKPGNRNTVAVSTKCGLSLSLVIHGIEDESDAGSIQPKVIISTPDCTG